MTLYNLHYIMYETKRGIYRKKVLINLIIFSHGILATYLKKIVVNHTTISTSLQAIIEYLKGLRSQVCGGEANDFIVISKPKGDSYSHAQLVAPFIMKSYVLLQNLVPYTY